jgi:pimeloyl-ACP methyl ester carboxylesterase
MRREDHVIGETFAFRYPGENADHALLIEHGIASHAGIYDNFCARHAAHGVDVWSMDAPGHGRSVMTNRPGTFTFAQWVDNAVQVGEHIARTTGLPVIVKGSSLGASAAYGALVASDVFAGGVLMGYAIPGSPVVPEQNPFRSSAYEEIEASWGDRFLLSIDRLFDFDTDYGYVGAAQQKKADPYNTWFYDMKSWASLYRFDPAVRLADNTKPILYTVGECDPTFTPDVAKAVVDATGGPVEFYIHPHGKHQLMLFHSVEYSQIVLDWCRKTVATGTAVATIKES